jgi:hypothetical protein
MISGSASATACLTNSARVEGDRPVLAWPIRECRLRYPDGLDQAQARDPLVGMEPHPEARQTRTQRLFVCAPRGLGRRRERPGQPVSAGHPQITLTALRAISLSSARGAPARARMAMVCIVADARTASAAGSASSFSSPLSRAVRRRASKSASIVRNPAARLFRISGSSTASVTAVPRRLLSPHRRPDPGRAHAAA